MKTLINAKRETDRYDASEIEFQGNLFTDITLSGRDIRLKYSPVMTVLTGGNGSVKQVNILTGTGVENPQQIKRVS
jgi:hypothetical protein